MTGVCVKCQRKHNEKIAGSFNVHFNSYDRWQYLQKLLVMYAIFEYVWLMRINANL